MKIRISPLLEHKTFKFWKKTGIFKDTRGSQTSVMTQCSGAFLKIIWEEFWFLTPLRLFNLSKKYSMPNKAKNFHLKIVTKNSNKKQ